MWQKSEHKCRHITRRAHYLILISSLVLSVDENACCFVAINHNIDRHNFLGRKKSEKDNVENDHLHRKEQSLVPPPILFHISNTKVKPLKYFASYFMLMNL